MAVLDRPSSCQHLIIKDVRRADWTLRGGPREPITVRARCYRRRGQATTPIGVERTASREHTMHSGAEREAAHRRSATETITEEPLSWRTRPRPPARPPL